MGMAREARHPSTSLLTIFLELSASELKEQQLSDLKLLWSDTPFHAQTIGHMVRIHSAYTDELMQQENVRLIQCAEFIRDEKANSATTQDVTAKSLGLNTSRRPPKRLPPHFIKVESGANFGIDPQTAKQRPQPLLYPTPIINLQALQDIIIFLPNSKLVDLRPTIEAILVRGRTLGFGERHYDAIFKLLVQEHFPVFEKRHL